MRIATFDLEVKNNPAEVGWSNFGDMGISSFGIHITGDNNAQTFDENSLQDALELLDTADVLAGFNSLSFDLPLIVATCNRLELNMAMWSGAFCSPHYDILSRIKSVRNIRGKGINSLDTIAKKTIGKGKTEDGGDVPLLFANKEYDRIHAYCASDVMLTVELLDFINKNEYIINGNNETIYLPTVKKFIE